MMFFTLCRWSSYFWFCYQLVHTYHYVRVLPISFTEGATNREVQELFDTFTNGEIIPYVNQ